MNLNFLDFEQPIAELEAKVEELRFVTSDTEINISEEIARLQSKIKDLTKSIFASLTPWQVVKLARHPQRPRTLDYIERIFTDFDELHGDRHCGKGPALVAGPARLDNIPVMIIGQQKGRNTKENLERNFGMSNPEEYRRALRLMQMAEKYKLPVFTFIDTSGAHPCVEAEEHNQSEAIARNLMIMAQLKTPIICTVIGEGGSGGALGIGVGDCLLMLQYSIYSVISPEGCASILWRDQAEVEKAATALKLTAPDLLKLKLIDQVIPEPLGGAHRDIDTATANLKKVLLERLYAIQNQSDEKLLENRYKRLISFGRN
jgi:acetyl-CoA carboxylase carboxyl transferase subunit alpha